MSDLSNVDVWDFLERADVKNAHSASGGTEANFSCPFMGHNHGDENPSAYMNVETTAWFCWGCKRRGNAVSFWSERMLVSDAEARRFLREIYGIDFKEPMGGSMMSETDMRFAPSLPPVAPARPTESFLVSTRVDWTTGLGIDKGPYDYMMGRGFSAAVLMEFEVGYDFESDRITIPVRQLDGELFGVKSRGWREDQNPKYFILGDRRRLVYGFPPYESTEVVFGLARARECKKAVLLEGELNAVACRQAGIERPIAGGMSYLSDRQAELIVREADEVVLFYDPDSAGGIAADGSTAASGSRLPGAIEKLQDRVRLRIVEGHDCDPAKLIELGRGSEIIELVESARPTLLRSILL